MIAGIKIENGSCDPHYAPFMSFVTCTWNVALDIVYLLANFDD